MLLKLKRVAFLMAIFGMERDLENTIELRDNGWTVLRFWESDIKRNLDMCVERVLSEVDIKNNNFISKDVLL